MSVTPPSRAHNSGRKLPAVYKKTCSKTWVGKDHHRHACSLAPHKTGKHICECGESKR